MKNIVKWWKNLKRNIRNERNFRLFYKYVKTAQRLAIKHKADFVVIKEGNMLDVLQKGQFDRLYKGFKHIKIIYHAKNHSA